MSDLQTTEEHQTKIKYFGAGLMPVLSSNWRNVGSRALNFSSGHSSSDDAEKALAITVGLLAGVAVLIVFAAFLRKAFGGKGK
ncbi:hypothetical protein C5167_005334 [Papaver somniferum]|uniref:Uncharacterized protein n=1 Tax=Papaver somniferum TaxID=3469 RepID=A0A4Y7JAA1_PAPSO|nr:hypothetical protein C5167_005334 [Papaver somniferum]